MATSANGQPISGAATCYHPYGSLRSGGSGLFTERRFTGRSAGLQLAKVEIRRMGSRGDIMLDPWEALWSPYDDATYDAVLAGIEADDVVLEIGAGDLRLARRLARVARQVWAWEIQPQLLRRARGAGPLPANLAAVCVDARRAPVPPGVSVAVLLMRHCTHYALYVARLRAAGCARLITNARWRVGVEIVDLTPGMALESALPGWYTCRKCGSVGFKADAAADVDDLALSRVSDVEGCPACDGDPVPG